MNFISKIGVGTVQFGTKYGISNSYGQTSEKEVSTILELASQVGIDIIDTANGYGSSENVLGQNDLSNFKIVSKFLRQDPSQSVSKILFSSLKKLKTSSVYGYMSHRPMDVVYNP